MLLGVIMVAALLLRFWNFWNIPFTFDELSAMSRTTFDSFSELIRVGVAERDTHPAGIQVFMYYWVMWFGEAEWIVKLPFMLAGLVSVWLVFQITNLWFGRTNALFSAAYVSSLQLFVMYGQIARPYVSGLFFTLMMVYFWSNYFIGNRKKINLVFFVVFASLSSYNHHFSLLFVAIVGLSGFFFTRRNQHIPYIISGISIFLLYVPHLDIFFSQLEKGGIGGWLGKPGILFPLEFLGWLFHYSYLVYGLLVIIIIFTLIRTKQGESTGLNAKKRIILLIWFLVPILIGYLYSVIREPVIQYSLLIFSTPYLFMLIFSFSGNIRIRILTPLIILILLVNILTLIYSREYYKLFYRQPYEQVVKRAVNLDENNGGNVFIINNYVPYYSEYYLRKYGQSIPYFTTRNKEISIEDFKKTLKKIKQKTIITSGLDVKYFQLINERFPNWIDYESGFTYEHYVLSKEGAGYDNSEIIKRKLIMTTSFDEESGKLEYVRRLDQNEVLPGDHFYEVRKDKKYDLKSEIKLDELISDIYWIIDIEVEFMVDQSEFDAMFIGEIKNGSITKHWKSIRLSDFGVNPGKWQKGFLTLDIQTGLNNRNQIEDQMLRFYIWNKSNDKFFVRKINVYLRPGNPDRYTLLTK